MGPLGCVHFSDRCWQVVLVCPGVLGSWSSPCTRAFACRSRAEFWSNEHDEDAPPRPSGPPLCLAERTCLSSSQVRSLHQNHSNQGLFQERFGETYSSLTFDPKSGPDLHRGIPRPRALLASRVHVPRSSAALLPRKPAASPRPSVPLLSAPTPEKKRHSPSCRAAPGGCARPFSGRCAGCGCSPFLGRYAAPP